MSKFFAVFRRRKNQIFQEPMDPKDTPPKDEVACLKVTQESELNQMDNKKKIDDMLQEYMKQIEALKGQDKVYIVGKDVKGTDLTVYRLKDDLRSIQDRYKDAVYKLAELMKERQEQNKTIVTQKNQISSLLTQLEVYRKEYDEKTVKVEEQLKQPRQERGQMKNLLTEHEQVQQKAEESKTLIKKLESELMRNIIKNKQITEGLKKNLIAKDQELCMERDKVRNIQTLVERMKDDIQKGSSFLQHPKMLKDYFIKLNRCYIHNADVTDEIDIEVTTEQTRQQMFLERRLRKQDVMEVKNQEAYPAKVMKMASLLSQNLIQERKKSHETQMVLKKQKIPSVESTVSSDQALKESLQESKDVTKLHRAEIQKLRKGEQELCAKVKSQGQPTFCCSSGALELPPIDN